MMKVYLPQTQKKPLTNQDQGLLNNIGRALAEKVGTGFSVRPTRPLKREEISETLLADLAATYSPMP